MRLLRFALVVQFIHAEFHNALEEWNSMFSSGWVHPSPGRQLGIAKASIEFSKEEINHRGRVVIHVVAPHIANTAVCNKAYVAVYTPPDADLNTTTPIRYQAMISNSSFCATGNASFTFQLNNLHTGGYRAYLLHGGVNKATFVTSQTTPYRPGAKPYVAITSLQPGMNLPSIVLATSSFDINFRQPNEPTHVRITVGGDDERGQQGQQGGQGKGEKRGGGRGGRAQEGMYVISWNHNENSTGGVLRYSTDNSSQNAFEGGILADSPTVWSMSLLDVCSHGPAAGPGFRSMGIQYSVDINLTQYAGQTIFYAVGDDTSPSSQTFNFTVPLLPGTFTSTPQEWLIYADQGVGYADDSYNGRNLNNGKSAVAVAEKVTQLTKQRVYQGILVSGDVTYADGYIAQIEDYMDMTEGHFSRAVALTSAGNHEIDWYRVAPLVQFANSHTSYDSPDGSTKTMDFWADDNAPDSQIASGGECGVSFKVWPQSSATPDKPWYVYAAGIMTMIVLSSEHNFFTGSEQWLWFNHSLSLVNRTETPWLFVTIHRPMYVAAQADTYRSGFTENSNLFVQHLEPLYLSYKVDFVMTGHYHATQRMCAISNFTCELPLPETDQDGFAVYDGPTVPIHWLIGNTGANTDFIYNGSNFTLFQSLTPTIGMLTLYSADRLELQLVEPTSGVAIDKARILRANSSIIISSSSNRKMGNNMSALTSVVVSSDDDGDDDENTTSPSNSSSTSSSSSWPSFSPSLYPTSSPSLSSLSPSSSAPSAATIIALVPSTSTFNNRSSPSSSPSHFFRNVTHGPISPIEANSTDNSTSSFYPGASSIMPVESFPTNSPPDTSSVRAINTSASSGSPSVFRSLSPTPSPSANKALCDDPIFGNFFSNCTQKDFPSGQNWRCTSACASAANALQAEDDLPSDCIPLYNYTTIDSDTLLQIQEKVTDLQPLCGSVYSAAASPLYLIWIVLVAFRCLLQLS